MAKTIQLQHDVVAQTLYSGRCTSDKALYFTYSLAQARADVFFSLLFGGRIMVSAGSFFDSPIALRIFGELLSHPRFSTLKLEEPWYPLRLNTDNIESWDKSSDYLISRWRDKTLKFVIFREHDDSFISTTSLDIAKTKDIAADCLAAGQFARLRNLYQSFLVDFRLQAFECQGGADSAQYGGTDAANTGVLPILTDDFATWLRSILQYLDETRSLESLSAERYVEHITTFAPLASVNKRLQDIGPSKTANMDSREFFERVGYFSKIVGDAPTMNSFHKFGPDIYGHYFAMVNHWIEQDWHTARHTAYRSATCLLSSNWESRDVFDFDVNSKINYLTAPVIDDKLRRTQESFGALDWEILFEVLQLKEWASSIYRIREAKNQSDIDRASDDILNLLATSMTDFTFDNNAGNVAIAGRRVDNATKTLNAASIITSLVSPISHLLGVGKFVGSASTLTTLGARWIYKPFAGRQLRTTVVPSLYLQ